MSDCNHDWASQTGYGGTTVICRYCHEKANAKEITNLRQQLAESEARVAELESTLYHGNLEREKCQKAMILRKQAEAVEPAIRTALHNLGNADITEEDIRVFAEQYAQRLRNQADELEKAGGE